MRALVTGGLGFIGSHVVSALGAGTTVRVLDTRAPPKGLEAESIRGSVLDAKALAKATKGCDEVYHLAGVVGVSLSESDPIQTLDVNAIGTKMVLEACRSNGVGRFILSSSSEVYGEPVTLPIREADPSRPVTTYGVSKLTAEHYVQSYGKMHGIDYAILRLFNVYGPGQSDAFVIPRFVKAALKGEDLVVHGDGEQVRAFCHVGDAASAMLAAMKKNGNTVYNIGNDGEPVSMRDLAEKVIAVTKSKSKVRFQSFGDTDRKRSSEIIRRVPSIAKAMEALSYRPRINLEEGIVEVADSLRNSS